MEIIEFFSSENKNHWLDELQKCEWEAGKLLYEMLTKNTIYNFTGPNPKIFFLTENNKIASFCTLTKQDDINAPEIFPWIGFVYTYPEYRGQHSAGKLIAYCELIAKKMNYKYVHISTGFEGLYEKYGYEFYKTLENVNGEFSRVYRKPL